MRIFCEARINELQVHRCRIKELQPDHTANLQLFFIVFSELLSLQELSPIKQPRGLQYFAF